MDYNIFHQRLDLSDYLYHSPISVTQIQDFLKSLPVISLSDIPEGKCPICIEPFQDALDAERPVRLPCKHTFGYDCLEKWLTSSVLNRNNKHCPTCRAALFERYYGPRPQVEMREYNDLDFLNFQREYERLREAVAERRREHTRTREQNERFEARLAALRERTNDPAVSLRDQGGVRQIDRDQRRAGLSDRRILGQDDPDLSSSIRGRETLFGNIRDLRAEQEERERREEVARSAIRAQMNQVSHAVQTYRDRESSGLSDENERHRVWMLLQQGLYLERSFIADIVNSDPTEPLVRQLHLQNQAMAPLRDHLARAGAAGRPRAHRYVENMFERQRLGLPPLSPTLGREEASVGQSDRFMTLQQRADEISEQADRIGLALDGLEGQVQFDAENIARSRPRAGAGAMRHRADHLNRTRSQVQRTLAEVEQQELPATERLNRTDASSYIPRSFSGLNARIGQTDRSVVGSRQPATEGPATRPDTSVPFPTPTPAARVTYSQTRFPLNSTTARMQEPAPRPQPLQQPEARSVRRRRFNRPEDALRFTLPRFEARTQQQQ